MEKVVIYVDMDGEEHDSATECMTADIEKCTLLDIVHRCKENGEDCLTCPFYYDSQCCVTSYLCGGSDYDKITSPNMWGGLKLDKECD